VSVRKQGATCFTSHRSPFCYDILYEFQKVAELEAVEQLRYFKPPMSVWEVDRLKNEVGSLMNTAHISLARKGKVVDFGGPRSSQVVGNTPPINPSALISPLVTGAVTTPVESAFAFGDVL
jgi:hypothetical protein